MSSSATAATEASVASTPGFRKFSLLAALYVSQAIPLGFFIEAIPAIGRDIGLSLRDIGLVQALALPFMIKFLWAPVIDAYGSATRGHYRSWLFPLQMLSVAMVISIALLNPAAQTGLLLSLGALFLFLAATQDIASDGLAVQILSVDERGVGNGIQVGGYYLGQILGGGLMLVLFSRYGWTTALFAMAAILALPLLNLWKFREPTTAAPARKIDWGALGRFFRRPGIAVWIVILLVYRAGDAMAMTMFKPMLVDKGLDLAQIGLIVGLGNSVAALSGALVGGAAVTRIGRRRSLVVFALIQAIALSTLAIPAAREVSLPTIWIASMAAAFAGGMATSALYTRMMDQCSTATAGTDFTLQQSLAVIGPLLGAGVSGVLAQRMGYAAHFMFCGVLVLGIAIFTWVGLRVSSTPDKSSLQRSSA